MGLVGQAEELDLHPESDGILKGSKKKGDLASRFTI
jgi:hypothetical protein